MSFDVLCESVCEHPVCVLVCAYVSVLVCLCVSVCECMCVCVLSSHEFAVVSAYKHACRDQKMPGVFFNLYLARQREVL